MKDKATEKNISGQRAQEIGSVLLESSFGLRLRVGGFSMYPFLKDGDIALIEKCSLDALKPGDVVVFKRAGKWIAHRLLKKIKLNGKTTLLAKGDSCLKTDPAVSGEMFAGRIVSAERKGKTILLNNQGLYSIIILKLSKTSGFLLHALVRLRHYWIKFVIPFLVSR